MDRVSEGVGGIGENDVRGGRSNRAEEGGEEGSYMSGSVMFQVVCKVASNSVRCRVT